MPFVQMENISIFLRACQAPPLNLHQHDVFLTVDLFEQKDPAQVLQCLGAFSRAANAADPATFPTTMGPRSRLGGVSPQATGPASPKALRNRGASIASNASSAHGSSRPVLPHRTGDSVSGRWSPSRSPTRSHVKSPSNGGSPSRVSTWRRRDQESVTSPAWNIAQYGYMGGASQGNLGISFGGRRQITGAGPQVPSLAEKERLRREEEERQRQEAEEEERRCRAEAEAEEEQARREEERRWEEETERQRRKAEEEQRQWEEQERQWQQTEQKRRQEEQEAQARLEEERRHVRSRSDNRLRGQFLSQYKTEQEDADDSPSGQVRELEKALELARQREAEYERERGQRPSRPARAVSEKVASRPPPPVKSSSRVKTRIESWSRNQREVLQTQWEQEQEQKAAQEAQSAEEADDAQPDAESPVAAPRPLPDPTAGAGPKSRSSTAGSRPLPDPANYGSPAMPQSRAGRFVSAGHTPASQPTAPQPQPTYPRELDAPAERDGEDRRRVQGQSKAKAGAWASKSLLEREMEMERQRQREWEEAQKETAKAVRSGDGGGVDGRWDVGQWSGYTGGDGQNRGAQGIGAGRRQIVGPRPLPGPNH